MRSWPCIMSCIVWSVPLSFLRTPHRPSKTLRIPLPFITKVPDPSRNESAASSTTRKPVQTVPMTPITWIGSTPVHSLLFSFFTSLSYPSSVPHLCLITLPFTTRPLPRNPPPRCNVPRRHLIGHLPLDARVAAAGGGLLAAARVCRFRRDRSVGGTTCRGCVSPGVAAAS